MCKIFLSKILFISCLLIGEVNAICTNEVSRNKPDSMYKDYGNGMVLDTKTNLVWQKCTFGQVYDSGSCSGTATSFSWDQAIEAARTANLSGLYGHSDWRVPNIKELFSLSELACSLPAINNSIFPGTIPDGSYWSSTQEPAAGGTASDRRAYAVSYAVGYYIQTLKSNNSRYLRLVRNK